MDLGLAGFEHQRGGGHVQPPYPGPGLTDLGHGIGPVRLKVSHPGAQGRTIVFTQILAVPELETSRLHDTDEHADLVQFTVGEDIPRDEVTPGRQRQRSEPRTVTRLPGRVAGEGDAMVEQPARRPQQIEQVAEIDRQHRGADVLHHPDGTDRVERTVADVPVIL